MPKDSATGLEVTIDRDRAPEPRGPEQSVEDAARKIFGPQTPGDRAPDELDAIDKRVFAASTRKARLFKFSNQKDCDAWADIQHKHASGALVRILRVKELRFREDYAQFLEWIEFAKPEEEVRIEATKAHELLLAKMRKTEKPAQKAQEKKGRKRAPKSIPLAEPDAPPPTHQSLEDPK